MTREAYKDSVDELKVSIFRLITTAAILSLNYFFILPTNFLIISSALVILSLVMLEWDIYEWRLYKNEIDK